MALTAQQKKEIQEKVAKSFGASVGAPEPEEVSRKDYIKSIVSTTSDSSPLSSPTSKKKLPKSENPIIDFGKGILKGAGTTLQNVGNIVAKPLGKAFGMKDEEIGLQGDILNPTTGAQKAGFTTERVAEFLAPAGKIASATKGLSFLPRVLARTGADVAIATAQDGNMDNATTNAGLSIGLQSASPVLKFMGTILGNTLKRGAGAVSGVGSDVIEATLKNPKQALSTIKVPPLASLKQDTQKILKSTLNLGRESTKNYGMALDDLPKTLGRPAKVINAGGKTTIKTGGKTYTLSTLGLKANTTKVLRDYGAKVNPKTGAIDFMSTTLDSGETKRLQEVWNLVRKWKDTTPKGINTLATKIKGYERAGEQSKQLNAMIRKMSSGARNYIGKRVPAVRELNDRFMAEQKFLDEIKVHLGNRNGFDTPQNAKIVASKLQSLFGKNKEMAREVLDALDGNIAGRQAGREFATDVPLSGARIGDTISNVFKAVIPPSVVGEIVARTGLAIEKVQPIIDSLGGLEPSARAILLGVLRDSQPDSQEQQ